MVSYGQRNAEKWINLNSDRNLKQYQLYDHNQKRKKKKLQVKSISCSSLDLMKGTLVFLLATYMVELKIR